MRRQDEVLRVIDEEPRLFGLRFRSCIHLFVVVAFTWGLFVVVTHLLAMKPGLGAWTTMVGIWTAAFATIRWVESREDVDFLGATLRYAIAGRGRSLYGGAEPVACVPHALDRLLTTLRTDVTESA